MFRRILLFTLPLVALLSASCLESQTETCGEEGIICPEGWLCIEDLSACIDPAESLCGNGVIDRPAFCDAECPLGSTDEKCAACEECDDGNYANGDGCNWNCKIPTCGDGIVGSYWKDDAGNYCQEGAAGCTEYKEVCDDGNTRSGDGCSADCLSKEVCGDGIVNDAPHPIRDVFGEITADYAAPEACDPGTGWDPSEPDRAVGPTEDCTEFCQESYCGDGVVNEAAGEECDPGTGRGDNGLALAPSDSCNIDCTPSKCGDGKPSLGEACDLGSFCEDLKACDSEADCTHMPAGQQSCEPRDLPCCTKECDAIPSCGDGIVQGSFECQDPTEEDDNGVLQAHCEACTGRWKHNFGQEEGPFEGDSILEECDPGRVCSRDRSVSCQDNTDCDSAGLGECLIDDQNDTCNASCQRIVCGDRRIDHNEDCDLGRFCEDGTPCFDDTECTGEDNFCLPRTGMDRTCDDANPDADFEGTRCTSDNDCQGLGDELCLNRAFNDNDNVPENLRALPFACLADCTASYCGDHKKDDNEECDLGPNGGVSADGKGCTAQCRLAECGDGEVQPDFNETCDLGPFNGTGLAVDATSLDLYLRKGAGYSERIAGMNKLLAGTDSVTPDSSWADDEISELLPKVIAALRCEGDDAQDCSRPCTRQCEISACGDGKLDPGEDCDVGGYCGGTLTGARCTRDDQCPDGDTCTPVGGEGCTANCRIEVGWYCADLYEEGGEGAPDHTDTDPNQTEDTTGGDGLIDTTSGDDTATDTGDGDIDDDTDPAEFTIDPGNICGEMETTCGDFFVRGAEACDDGMHCDDGEPCENDDGCGGIPGSCKPRSGDGCSATCQVETGYDCPGGEGHFLGGACRPICGDGIINVDAGETCDDGNTNSGDGCDANCQVEDGWECNESGDPNDGPFDQTSGVFETPSQCFSLCGDGKVVGLEVCDEGLTGPSGGCDQCETIVSGWYCDTPGIPCVTQFGDGVIAGNEACDYDLNNPPTNSRLAEACVAPGRVLPGWSCPIPQDGTPQDCHTTFGDGIVAGDEECDYPADAAPEDLRRIACEDVGGIGKIQPGFLCTNETTPHTQDGVSVDIKVTVSCISNCGDGDVVETEDCDEGQANSSNSPLATCTAGCEVATCADGLQNRPYAYDDDGELLDLELIAPETDVDCGGICAAREGRRCYVSQKCVENSDCVSFNCQSGVCTEREFGDSLDTIEGETLRIDMLDDLFGGEQDAMPADPSSLTYVSACGVVLTYELGQLNPDNADGEDRDLLIYEAPDTRNGWQAPADAGCEFEEGTEAIDTLTIEEVVKVIRINRYPSIDDVSVCVPQGTNQVVLTHLDVGFADLDGDAFGKFETHGDDASTDLGPIFALGKALRISINSDPVPTAREYEIPYRAFDDRSNAAGTGASWFVTLKALPELVDQAHVLHAGSEMQVQLADFLISNPNPSSFDYAVGTARSGNFAPNAQSEKGGQCGITGTQMTYSAPATVAETLDDACYIRVCEACGSGDGACEVAKLSLRVHRGATATDDTIAVIADERRSFHIGDLLDNDIAVAASSLQFDTSADANLSVTREGSNLMVVATGPAVERSFTYSVCPAAIPSCDGDERKSATVTVQVAQKPDLSTLIPGAQCGAITALDLSGAQPSLHNVKVLSAPAGTTSNANGITLPSGLLGHHTVAFQACVEDLRNSLLACSEEEWEFEIPVAPTLKAGLNIVTASPNLTLELKTGADPTHLVESFNGHEASDYQMSVANNPDANPDNVCSIPTGASAVTVSLGASLVTSCDIAVTTCGSDAVQTHVVFTQVGCVQPGTQDDCNNGEWCGYDRECHTCLIDDHCDSGVCGPNGTCVACLDNDDCGGDAVCDLSGNAPLCVACTKDSHCEANEYCTQESTCASCLHDSHCGEQEVCGENGTCIPALAAPTNVQANQTGTPKPAESKVSVSWDEVTALGHGDNADYLVTLYDAETGQQVTPSCDAQGSTSTSCQIDAVAPGKYYVQVTVTSHSTPPESATSAPSAPFIVHGCSDTDACEAGETCTDPSVSDYRFCRTALAPPTNFDAELNTAHQTVTFTWGAPGALDGRIPYFYEVRDSDGHTLCTVIPPAPLSCTVPYPADVTKAVHVRLTTNDGSSESDPHQIGECNSFADCGPGGVCNGQDFECVSCNASPAGQECNGGVCNGAEQCVACTENTHCEAGQVCNSDNDCVPACTDATDCPDKGVCDEGLCVSCNESPVGHECNGGVCSEDGSCEECVEDTHCEGDQVCTSDNHCVPSCDDATDCPDQGVCDDGQCVSCNESPVGQECNGGTCDDAGECVP